MSGFKADIVSTAGRLVAGLCILGVVVWAIVEAITADPAVAGSIIGSIATAAVGAFAVVFEQARAGKQRRRDVQRERMEPAYKDFVWCAYQRFASQGTVANDAMTELKAKLLVVGADATVIRALVDFERIKPSDDEPLAPALAMKRSSDRPAAIWAIRTQRCERATFFCASSATISRRYAALLLRPGVGSASTNSGGRFRLASQISKPIR